MWEWIGISVAVALVIAFIVYKAIEFLRETRAGQLVKGIVLLFALYAFAIVFVIYRNIFLHILA